MQINIWSVMSLKGKMYYESLNDECLLQESGIYWQDKVTQNIVFHMNSRIFIKLENENEADNSGIDVKHSCRKQLWWRNQKKISLTHRDHVTVVLQHDFPVQSPLCKVEAVPLIWREINCHILECQDSLSWKKRVYQVPMYIFLYLD